MDGRGSNPVAGGNAGDGGRRGGATNTTAADDLGIVDDGNIENVWNHGLRVGAGFKCRYCYWMKKGGGATRLREHLGGISGNVMSCNVVPPDVRDAMRIAIRKGKQKRRDAKERKLRIEDELTEGVDRRAQVDDDEDDDLQRALAASMRDLHFRQGLEGRSGTLNHGSASGSGSGSGATSCAGNSGRIGMMFRNAGATGRVYDADVSRSRTSTQGRVDTLFSKTAHEDVGKAWAKWFHANDIPGKKADCPYFRGAMKLTQQLGKGAHIPKGSEIDGSYLQGNFDELQKYVEQFKKDWGTFGVTIMCDSWTGPTSMSIMNFMVYCNGRMFFHKSINATGFSS